MRKIWVAILVCFFLSLSSVYAAQVDIPDSKGTFSKEVKAALVSNLTQLFGETVSSIVLSGSDLIITFSNATTKTASLAGLSATLPATATQAEMEAGVEVALRSMTPLAIKQAIVANLVPAIATINSSLADKASTVNVPSIVASHDFTPTAKVDTSQASTHESGYPRLYPAGDTVNYVNFFVNPLTGVRNVEIGDYVGKIPAKSSLNDDGTIIFPEFVTGSFDFDTFPIYSTSPHDSGIARNGTTLAIYVPSVSKWLTTPLSDTLGLPPTTYTLSLSVLGAVGADKVRANSVDYTADASIAGLTSSAVPVVVYPDTGRQASCTGDVTGTTPTYSMDLSAANKSVACTFSAIAAAFSYSDTFNTSTLAAKGWTIIGGVEQDDVSGRVGGLNINSINMLIRTVNPSVLNGNISVAVLRTGASTQAQPGTSFRYIDENNYSVIYIRPWSSELVYYKLVAGEATGAVIGSLSLPSNTERILNLSFDGTAISVSYGGSVILTATDSNPLAGNMGPFLKEGAALAAKVNDWSGESK